MEFLVRIINKFLVAREKGGCWQYKVARIWAARGASEVEGGGGGGGPLVAWECVADTQQAKEARKKALEEMSAETKPKFENQYNIFHVILYDQCAECSAPEPDWASLKFGILIEVEKELGWWFSKGRKRGSVFRNQPKQSQSGKKFQLVVKDVRVEILSNPHDDPMFLSNSDSPAMELGNTKFSGTNFLSWSRCVVMALGTENKQGFLTGAVAMPALTSPKYSQWIRCDYMVRYWLLNSIDQDLKENFITCKSAKSLWTDLCERAAGQGKGPWNVWKRDDKKEENKPKVDDIWCYHCNKKGHLPESCFIKFPELKAKFLARFSGNAAGGPMFNQPTQAFQYPAAPSTSQYGAQYAPPHTSPGFSVWFSTAACFSAGHTSTAKNDSPVDFSDASVNFTGITLANQKACDTCKDAWIIDSGATDHMTGHKHYFDCLQLLRKTILIGLPDGSSQLVTYGGHITLESGIRLHNVLYVPAFKHNLLSVGKLLSTTQLLIRFFVDKCVIQDPASIIPVGVGLQERGLYKLKHRVPRHSIAPNKVGTAASCSCSSFDNYMKHYDCETCLEAKIHRLPFDRSIHRAAYDYSRVTWTFLLKFKTQVASILDNFLARVENFYNSSVKLIGSDNGTEIIHDTCLGLLAKRGILHKKLPKRFWGESVLTATYIINKLPFPVLGWKTPYEVLFSKMPTYEELRTFGCLCYAPINSLTKDKFASKGRRCMFIGYPFGQKAYKLFDLDNKKIFVSRDVIFLEHKFPFHNQNEDSSTDPYTFPAHSIDDDEPNFISSPILNSHTDIIL
ncbi:uncharacterized protein LOC141655058 [Silene latifolia]|uniref:uncharacterized protein LOC141655058 n=1 Tax=Silene latifolia TaxID=37657 RepID=UPI003D77CC01